jgi:hypothetical protein
VLLPLVALQTGVANLPAPCPPWLMLCCAEKSHSKCGPSACSPLFHTITYFGWTLVDVASTRSLWKYARRLTGDCTRNSQHNATKMRETCRKQFIQAQPYTGQSIMGFADHIRVLKSWAVVNHLTNWPLLSQRGKLNQENKAANVPSNQCAKGGSIPQPRKQPTKELKDVASPQPQPVSVLSILTGYHTCKCIKAYSSGGKSHTLVPEMYHAEACSPAHPICAGASVAGRCHAPEAQRQRRGSNASVD